MYREDYKHFLPTNVINFVLSEAQTPILQFNIASIENATSLYSFIF